MRNGRAVALGVAFTLLLALLVAGCADPFGAATPTLDAAAPERAGQALGTISASTATRGVASPTATLEPTGTPTAPPATPTPEPAPEEPTEPEQPAVLNGDPYWHQAIVTPDGAYMGVVTATGLNIRSEPSPDAPVVDTTYARHLVTAYDTAWDEASQSLWYRIGDGRYVAADYVEPFIPPTPPETYDGQWVDVNLTDFYAVAYDGATPVYAAIITAGKDDQTPLGVYSIKYRVRIGDMDAATLGVAKDDPDYYFQPDVEYAQYFKAGGFAIHGNYWVPPSQFGGFSSHGCVGLLNADAAWFWDFLSKGSTVSIHY